MFFFSLTVALDFDLIFVRTFTLSGTKACPLACGACEADPIYLVAAAAAEAAARGVC